MGTNESEVSALSIYFEFFDSLRALQGTPVTRHPFHELRSRHFEQWSDRNSRVLKTLLPGVLYDSVREGRLEIEQARRVARAVEDHLFGQLVVNGRPFSRLLVEHGPDLLEGVAALTADALDGKVPEAERLARAGINLVLVRPEILYLQDLVVELLGSHGFEVLQARELVLAPEQYLVLYNHVFTQPIKESHVRRRAFGYVNQTCVVLLIRRVAGLAGTEEPVAYLNRAVKGTVMIEDRRTLRGGIGLAEAVVNHLDTDGRIRRSLDPFQSYTLLDATTADLSSKERFISNLHSVHVPSKDEIVKDLCVLCDLETLQGLR